MQDHERLYDTPTFTDVWPEDSDFITDFKQSKMSGCVADKSAEIIYYFLYSRFGGTPIISTNVNQWKYKMFMTIFQYGPTWEKKLSIQEKIRAMSDEELTLGSKSIHNHAFNPPGEPTTASLEELAQIDDQSTSTYKRSKIDAYGNVWGLLATDVTEAFMDRFTRLFMPIPGFACPIFENEEEDYE